MNKIKNWYASLPANKRSMVDGIAFTLFLLLMLVIAGVANPGDLPK